MYYKTSKRQLVKFTLLNKMIQYGYLRLKKCPYSSTYALYVLQQSHLLFQ